MRNRAFNLLVSRIVERKLTTYAITLELALFMLTGFFVMINLFVALGFLLGGLVMAAIAGEAIKERAKLEVIETWT